MHLKYLTVFPFHFKGGGLEVKMVHFPRWNESSNFIVKLFSPHFLFSGDKTCKILKAHSMFVYRASWMYILYIVDLPNLCRVSQIMLFRVV